MGEADDAVHVGDTLVTSVGVCVVTAVTWRKHKGKQIDVRFEDGEHCRFSAWKLMVLCRRAAHTVCKEG